MWNASGKTATIYVMFFLSGIAGLGYEIVWARMFAVGLGHEYPSLLAVVAAFFGGFAIGAWCFDAVVSQTRFPGRWYAALEVAIGVWALVTMAAIPWANGRVAEFTGVTPSAMRHWGVAFLVPLLTLLPATAAMGATFSAIDRLCCRLRQDGRSIGALYALNTLGAVFGVLLSTFVLIPGWGYRWTLTILAAVNFLCAATVLAGPARGEADRSEVPSESGSSRGPTYLWTAALVTGMLGIGYEMLAVRVMAQVLENTIFSFAVALSVYLLGTAAGAALYQRFVPPDAGDQLLTRLFHALAVLCGLETLVLWNSRQIYEFARLFLGGRMAGSLGAEFVLAAVVFLLPTFLMGATLSHLLQSARHARGGVGKVLALNTLGSSGGPLVCMVIVLPFLAARFPLMGSKFTLVLIGYGYVLLSPKIRFGQFLPVVLLLAAILLAPFSLFIVEREGGEKLIAAREGLMGTITVTEQKVEGVSATPAGRRLVLKVNSKFRMGGSGRGEFADRRRGHIPLLLHPDPKRALFLGTGTGVTMSTAASHQGLAADGVELIPEVMELMRYFDEVNAHALDSELLKVSNADARRYIRANPDRYDVVVADLFHPSRDGAGSLYTVEHFRAVRARLTDGGVFCQWLPLFQLDLDVLQIIIRSYLEVFPHTRGYLCYFNVDTPMLGLIGQRHATRYPANWQQERLRSAALRSALEGTGLNGSVHLFGCYLASGEDLARFAGSVPLNTDDRPVVTFLAPRLAYARETGARENLEALLDASSSEAGELFDAAATGSGHAGLVARVSDYIRARDLYLRALFSWNEQPGEPAVELFARSVRASSDFVPAYDFLRDLAESVAASNPQEARRVLTSLAEANPARPDAPALLERLFEK
ncbi:MAG: spermidine synthase [Planctomycetaceae bacterium]|nr:spermidine synthase [Planctomycetaceae bacterium]